MGYRNIDWEEESIRREFDKIESSFMSVTQVAKILQVNPLTVKRWIWNVKLPAWNTRKDGKGHWRIAKESIYDFIQKRNSMNIDF